MLNRLQLENTGMDTGKTNMEIKQPNIELGHVELPPPQTIDYDAIISSQARDISRFNPVELTYRNHEGLKNLVHDASDNIENIPSFYKMAWNDVPSTTDPKTGEKTYEVHSGKTDENGNPNPEHDLLNQVPLPENATIIVHQPDGSITVYKTDHLGRVKSMEHKGELTTVAKEDTQRQQNTSSVNTQTTKTKILKDGKENDHGGHLLGDQFGGCSEQINLVPMSPETNLSAFKKIENTLKKNIEEGKSVTDFKVEPIYEGDSARPVGFKVSYKIDGKPYTTAISNN